MANSLFARGSANPAADATPAAELHHLPNVSEEIRARVTQHLRRAPSISFITDDEDSESDDDASLRK